MITSLCHLTHPFRMSRYELERRGNERVQLGEVHGLHAGPLPPLIYSGKRVVWHHWTQGKTRGLNGILCSLAQ